jgi:hypothetical protein
MTEAEWLAYSEPTPLFGHLQQAGLPRTNWLLICAPLGRTFGAATSSICAWA